MTSPKIISNEMQFHVAAAMARDADSELGPKVSKKEIDGALAILSNDGYVSQGDAHLARVEFQGAEKSRGATKALKVFMGGASGLSTSMQAKIEKAFKRLNDVADFTTPIHLPTDMKFKRLYLKGNAMVDGFEFTALVSSNRAKSFYVERSGGRAATEIYGPFEVAAPNPKSWAKLDSPKVESIDGSAMRRTKPQLILSGGMGVNQELAYTIKDLGRRGLEITAGAKTVRTGIAIDLLKLDRKTVDLQGHVNLGETRPYVVKNPNGSVIQRGEISSHFEIGMVRPTPR